ncbi:hypothetical protein KEM56_006257 [Ascosphaera pollenicola]|nr:hypothetical protein KEM56_006257 [Ascosphaera pollenicola]
MQLKTVLVTALGLGNLAVAQDLLTALSGIKETRDFFNRINNDPILKPIFETVKNVTVVAPLDAALRAIKGSEVVIHKDKGKGGKGDKDKSGQQSQPPDQLARSQVIYHILDGIYPQSAINNIPQFIPTKVVSQSRSAAGNATGGQEQSFLRNQTVPSNVTFANVEGSQVVKADKAGKSVRFTGGLNVAGKVTKGDIRFDGGVIHVIDHALPSPQTVTDTLRAANLTQLLGAIHQTGLQDLFDFLPNITVFAPRNESFNKISNVVNNMSIQQSKVKGTIKQIDTDLANILRYTIGRGVYYSTHLNNLTIPSLVSDGQELLTSLTKGNGFINNAKAVSTDLLTNNGVIHVIDNVLNPQNVTVPASGNAKSGSVMFANASNGHANLAQNVGSNNKPIPLPAATPITPVPRPAATPLTSYLEVMHDVMGVESARQTEQ